MRIARATIDEGKLLLGEIPVGTVFDATIGTQVTGPFLRTFDEVVSLSAPQLTWRNLREVSAFGYMPLTVELTIFGKEL